MLRWREKTSAHPRKDEEKGTHTPLLHFVLDLTSTRTEYRSGSIKATSSFSPYETSKTTKPTLSSNTPRTKPEISKPMVNYPRTRRSTRRRRSVRKTANAHSISERTTAMSTSTIYNPSNRWVATSATIVYGPGCA